MEEQGIYLYAIVPDVPVQDMGAIGLENGEVFTIAEGSLRAVVSAISATEELRPERRHLSAHQTVVNRILEHSSVVLPVSFGTIADDEAGVRRLLREHADELSEQMARLEGRVQMNVRLSYSAQSPTFFDHLVREHRPELNKLRDTLFSGGRTPTREEKIEFGQKIEAAMNELRDEFAERLTEALSGKCKEVKRLTPRSESEVARLACLVTKDSIDAFDSALASAAKTIDDRFTVDQSGPFPPYDFAELHLSGEDLRGGAETRADS